MKIKSFLCSTPVRDTSAICGTPNKKCKRGHKLNPRRQSLDFIQMNNSSAPRQAVFHKGLIQSSASTSAGRLFWVVVLSLFVTACGGSKSVVTYDDSADYSSARQLPPLKKPSKSATTSAPAAAQASVALPNQAATTPENVSAPTSAARQAESQVVSESPVTSAENIENTSAAVVTARVVEPSENIARLEVDAGIDAAWEYVSANLRGSNITVHNRNQVAGLIAVGCPQSDSGRPIISKRGGWSIFGRKPQQQEHCSLQLSKSRSKTAVSLFDRSGLEMDAEYAKDMFTRLLNN